MDFEGGIIFWSFDFWRICYGLSLWDLLFDSCFLLSSNFCWYGSSSFIGEIWENGWGWGGVSSLGLFVPKEYASSFLGSDLSNSNGDIADFVTSSFFESVVGVYIPLLGVTFYPPDSFFTGTFLYFQGGNSSLNSGLDFALDFSFEGDAGI